MASVDDGAAAVAWDCKPAAPGVAAWIRICWLGLLVSYTCCNAGIDGDALGGTSVIGLWAEHTLSDETGKSACMYSGSGTTRRVRRSFWFDELATTAWWISNMPRSMD